MTSPESSPNRYPAPPRQRLPAWVWGLGACACLPIIGVFALALLATPIFRRIKEAQREAGRTMICLTNVKQIAMGMQMYSQDYDERYPLAAGWMDRVVPYSGNGGVKDKLTLQCPTVQAVHPGDYGYAYNSDLSGKLQSKVVAAALTQMVYDSTHMERSASDRVASLPSPARHRTRAMRRNGGRANIMGYADGHAKAVSDKGKATNAPGLDTNQQR